MATAHRGGKRVRPEAAPVTLGQFFKLLWRQGVAALKKKALLAIGTFLVGWVVHTVLLIGPNGGFGRMFTLVGDAVASTGNKVSATLMWTLGGAVVASLIQRARGGRTGGLKDGIAWVRESYGRMGAVALPALLGGVALAFGAMAVFRNNLLGLVVGGSLVATLTSRGGSLWVMFLRAVWHDGQKLLRPGEGAPRPLDLAPTAVGTAGTALGFLVGFLLPGMRGGMFGFGFVRCLLPLVLGGLAVALYVSRRSAQGPPASGIAAVFLMATAFFMWTLPVLADDGGWAEAGGTLGGWATSEGAVKAVGAGVAPAVGGAIGAAIGAGLGGGAPGVPGVTPPPGPPGESEGPPERPEGPPEQPEAPPEEPEAPPEEPEAPPEEPEAPPEEPEAPPEEPEAPPEEPEGPPEEPEAPPEKPEGPPEEPEAPSEKPEAPPEEPEAPPEKPEAPPEKPEAPPEEPEGPPEQPEGPPEEPEAPPEEPEAPPEEPEAPPEEPETPPEQPEAPPEEPEGPPEEPEAPPEEPDEEARKKAEEEARKKAEEEARRKAEEEARKKAEEEARRKAEEEARKKAEEEARKKAEEEARRKAAEEARRKKMAELRKRQKRLEAEAAAANKSAWWWDVGTKAVETVQTAADLGVDVLETVTGPAGKTVKRVYTVAKGTATGLGEAIRDGEGYGEKMLKGTGKGFVDLGISELTGKLQDKLDTKNMWQSNPLTKQFKNFNAEAPLKDVSVSRVKNWLSGKSGSHIQGVVRRQFETGMKHAAQQKAHGEAVNWVKKQTGYDKAVDKFSEDLWKGNGG